MIINFVQISCYWYHTCPIFMRRSGRFKSTGLNTIMMRACNAEHGTIATAMRIDVLDLVTYGIYIGLSFDKILSYNQNEFIFVT